MKIREAYDIARNNIKGRKKIGWILGSIFFLAMLIYFIVNSVAGSLNLAVERIKETPMARTTVYKDWDNNGEIYEELKETCKDMKHVTEVYPYVDNIGIELKWPKENLDIEMELQASSDSYEEYLVKGAMPKENEILLPEFMNIAQDGGYEKSSEYIGQKIKFVVKDWMDKETEFEYTVSGTYDNVYAVTGEYVALVPPEEAVRLYEVSMEGADIQLEIDMAANGDTNKDLYYGYEPEYHYAVVVDSRDNLEEVKREIYKNLEASGHENVIFYDEEGTPNMFSFVRLIGNGIAVLLLVVVIVLMVIMIGNDIRGRRKEMAMYQVQGYTRKQLIQILGMEYAVRFIPVLPVTAIITAGLMALVNLVIKNMLSKEYQMIHMGITVGTFCMGVLIVGIVLGVAVYAISGQLKKITLLKEIKSEG